jgi:hypothetical protein
VRERTHRGSPTPDTDSISVLLVRQHDRHSILDTNMIPAYKTNGKSPLRGRAPSKRDENRDGYVDVDQTV